MVQAKRFALPFLAIAGITAAAPQAQAGFFDSLIYAPKYAVLYEGSHNLSVTNVTIIGNIGVGTGGTVNFSGPGQIYGGLDFASADTGQFNSTNSSNVNPTPINYSVAGVASAITEVNNLSTAMGALSGTVLNITGGMTIDASLGTLDGNGNRVFNVDSYTVADGQVVNIIGDAAGDSVVLNFGSLINSNVNLKGIVNLTGLTDDQVLWNFTTTGKTIKLDTNAGTTNPPAAFHGIILGPNDVLQLSDANLNGRFWGSKSGTDMQVVSNSGVNTVKGVPEPSSIILLLTAMLAGLGNYAFRSMPALKVLRSRPVAGFGVYRSRLT